MSAMKSRRGGPSGRTKPARPRPVMSDSLFAELRESVREGGSVLRGVREPSREYEIRSRSHSAEREMGSGRIATSADRRIGNGAPDVAAIRGRFRLSQAKFAALLGISTGTLRNWEQGRRAPEGAARVLLRVAAMYPGALLSVVAEAREARPRSRQQPA
jgi:putative transcriptional regulator